MVKSAADVNLICSSTTTDNIVTANYYNNFYHIIFQMFLVVFKVLHKAVQYYFLYYVQWIFCAYILK